MKKGGFLALCFLMFVLMFVQIISADFNYKNNSIRTEYLAGEKISGKFNISFSSQNAVSMLTSNFEGNVTLKEFLNRNNLTKGGHYNCSTTNCLEGYAAGNSISSFSLNGDKMIGIKLTGDVSEIISAKFGVQSNNEPSCSAQLNIDILANNENLIVNDQYNNVVCSPKDYGCFNSSANLGEVFITSNALCENISLQAGPAYSLGAKVKKSTNGKSGELRMELHDVEDGFLDDCTLPTPSQSGFNDLECTINYSSPIQKNYYACIVGDASESEVADGSGPDYKIRTEQNGKICGSDEFGVKSNRDYEISAANMQSMSFNRIIDDAYFDSKFNVYLRDYIYTYLEDSYEIGSNGIKCNAGCIIPIKISGGNQNIGLNNIQIRYKDGINLIEENLIYELTTQIPTINTKNILLELSLADFRIPVGSIKEDFRLYIDGNLIFRKDIKIEKSFDFDITPKSVLVGRKTDFQILYSKNISKSTWTFGNGSSVESNGKFVSYTFNNDGIFDVEVTIKGTDNSTSRKVFEVIVGDAKKSANLSISESRVKLVNITKEINSYPPYIKKEIEKQVNPVEINASLNVLEKKFNEARNDSEYVSIINSISGLGIPNKISKSVTGTLPIGIGFENIDVSYIEEITGREANNTEELEALIIGWNDKNYETNVDFEVISASTDNGRKALLSKFTFRITKVGDSTSEDYFLINYPYDKIKLAEDYKARGVGNGAGSAVPLEGSKNIEFIIPEELTVSDLGAYISPEITKFSIDDREICAEGECPGQEFPLIWFIILLIILLIVTLVVYIVLQEWYKKNYERHLFRNPDELYNLINFIYNGRSGDLDNGEIKAKLTNNGWKGEKISYAFRKIDGKRTGMWEIPLFKGKENRKVMEELEKRNTGGIDRRFIKQSEF